MAQHAIQNFTSLIGNTNTIEALLTMLSSVWKDQGVVVGLVPRATATPSMSVNIQYSSTQNDLGGNIGIAVLNIGGTIYSYQLKDTVSVPLTFAPNSQPSARFDLICIEFNTALKTHRLMVETGAIGADPNLASLETSTLKYLPIARVQVPASGGQITNGDIILAGNTNSGDNRAIRASATSYSTTKAMTLAERDARTWAVGETVIVKEALDTNNRLFVNVDTSGGLLWKQIALIGQLTSQWALLLTKALGLTNGTTTLAENEGSGSFTLPANFWGVGTVLEITETASLGGQITLVGSATPFIQTNNFLINGVSLFSNTFTGNYNVGTNPWYFNPTAGSTAIPTNFNKKTTIQCIGATSTTAQLQITTQNISNVANGSSNVFTTSNTTTIQTITQNIPMVISTNFVRTGVSSWGGTQANNLTVYTIQKQT